MILETLEVNCVAMDFVSRIANVVTKLSGVERHLGSYLQKSSRPSRRRPTGRTADETSLVRASLVHARGHRVDHRRLRSDWQTLPKMQPFAKLAKHTRLQGSHREVWKYEEITPFVRETATNNRRCRSGFDHSAELSCIAGKACFGTVWLPVRSKVRFKVPVSSPCGLG
jgi:hypothetical protein